MTFHLPQTSKLLGGYHACCCGEAEAVAFQRRLVPIIDSCKNVMPLKKFLVSRCKFNSERAEKVVERARVLQQRKDAAEGNGEKVQKEQDGANGTAAAEENSELIKGKEEEADEGYSEQIQTKTGWEQLKAEVRTRVVMDVYG